jgi:hypothetical protein
VSPLAYWNTSINGDGKDDYIYIHDGNVDVWINGGLQGSSWVWNSIGTVNGNLVGATRQNLQMVDIDRKLPNLYKKWGYADTTKGTAAPIS